MGETAGAMDGTEFATLPLAHTEALAERFVGLRIQLEVAGDQVEEIVAATLEAVSVCRAS